VVTDRQLVFRAHALRRMFERNISVDDVRHVVATGETIFEYPDDHPLPSRLILGWVSVEPIHVVAADEASSDITMVVTVYRPDPSQWSWDFRRRRR